MNIHHLELFYYVARHGGIMPAVRNIPYGIQQPAVSCQIAQLEEFFGVTLFQRRPFALTAEGEKLFEFIQPFFANLDKMASRNPGWPGAAYPHRRLNHRAARTSAGTVPSGAKKIFRAENVAARRLPCPIGNVASGG